MPIDAGRAPALPLNHFNQRGTTMTPPRICVFAATAALLFTAARIGRAAQATVTDDSYTSQAKPTTPMGSRDR